jgi:hypothetical protein
MPKPDDDAGSEFMAFAARNAGTLPTELTADHLVTLNTALRLLFAELRVAYWKHSNGDGYGRGGVVRTLGLTLRFLTMFKQPDAINIHTPVLHLINALMQLDNGVITKPLLERVVGGPDDGRPPGDVRYNALIGMVAATVKKLRQFGVPLDRALQQVADTLVEHGVRTHQNKEITSTTVSNWCKYVSAAPSGSEEKVVFNSMFSETENKPSGGLTRAQQRERALNALKGFLFEHFPRKLAEQSFS